MQADLMTLGGDLLDEIRVTLHLHAAAENACFDLFFFQNFELTLQTVIGGVLCPAGIGGIVISGLERIAHGTDTGRGAFLPALKHDSE